MRVLITGSNGQLGSEIRELAANYKKLDLVFKDLPGLDICNFNLLQSFIIDNNINAVINCAAYTAVDKAEQDAEIAEEVRVKGFFNCENALTPEFLSNIQKDVKSSGLSLNNNYVSGVYFTHGNQFFLTHMLAASKAFYNYCTNSKVLNFCKNIFGNQFRS